MSRWAFLRTIGESAFLVAFVSCGSEGEAEEPIRVPAQVSQAGGQTVDRVEGTNQPLAANPGEATEIVFKVDATGLHGPDSVPAGWVRILLENRGDADQHLALMRLTRGKTIDDLRSSIQQDPNALLPDWAVPSGGPADASPGVTAVVMQNLQEGRYVWVTYVLGDNEIGRPGLDLMRPFEVATSSVAGIEPTADVVLTILDHDYHVQDTRGRFDQYESGSGIAPGPRIIKIYNNSNMVHEARITLIEGGKQSREFPDLYYMSPKGTSLDFGLEAPLAPLKGSVRSS